MDNQQLFNMVFAIAGALWVGGGAGTTNSGISTTGVGGGLAHNNTQPTVVLNYIIKT